MKQQLKILHLEDDPHDAELIQATLAAELTPCDLIVVDTRKDFLNTIDKDTFDLILADYSLPQFDGISALEIVKTKYPDIPFIFVTGALGEELATETLKRGATDYVLKNKLSRLVPSIKRALNEAEERAEHKLAEEKIEHLNQVLLAIRNVNQLIVREKNRDRLIQSACDNLIETRGYYNVWIALLDEKNMLVTTASAGTGKDFLLVVDKLKRNELPACGKKALTQSEIVVIHNPPSSCTDCPLSDNYQGREGMSIRLEHEGKVYGLLTVSIPTRFIEDEVEHSILHEVANDIGFALHGVEVEEKRNLAEESLRESEEKFRTIFNNAPDGILIADLENKKFLLGNKKICHMLEYTEEEIKELGVSDIHPEKDLPHVIEQFKKQSRGEISLVSDLPVKRKDGTIFYADVNSFPISISGKTYLTGIFRDISERKETEEKLLKREQELKNRVKELEDFYEMGIGRELRMIELKREIEQLKEDLAKYKTNAGN